MKRRTTYLLYIVFALTVIVLLIVSNVVRRNSHVKDTVVTIDYHGSDTLLTSNALKEYIENTLPTLRTQKLKELDLKSIEKKVAMHPYILSSNASTSISGDLKINAHQRIPIIHIFAQDNDFYLDLDGKALPTVSQRAANVMIGNGHFRKAIPTALDSIDLDSLPALRNMWTLSKFIYSDSRYSILFDQVYLNNQGDLCLVPKLGNHVVIVGDTSNLERKMHDLYAFYTHGMNHVGWNTYKEINLKYRDQVVCKRRQRPR